MDEQTTARVKRLAARVGALRAMALLRCGEHTLDKLRYGGQLRPDALARVKAVLEELEQEGKVA